MKWDDSRRLTGPNLHLPGHCAIIEIQFSEEESPQLFLKHWRARAQQVLEQFGLQDEATFDGMISSRWAAVGFSAPIDQLYGATEMNE